jgi:hypothetical protein
MRHIDCWDFSSPAKIHQSPPPWVSMGTGCLSITWRPSWFAVPHRDWMISEPHTSRSCWCCSTTPNHAHKQYSSVQVLCACVNCDHLYRQLVQQSIDHQLTSQSRSDLLEPSTSTKRSLVIVILEVSPLNSPQVHIVACVGENEVRVQD